jgi:N-acetyl-anhydromuramyl-L-alanine amidase AmpD
MLIHDIITQEKGAFGPRPKNQVIDTIVVHYTDTGPLRRFSNDFEYNKKRIDNAFKVKGIDEETRDRLYDEFCNPRVINTMSDGTIMALIAASTPNEACAHYYISSYPIIPVGYDKPQIDVVLFVPESKQAHHIGPIGGRTNKRSIGIEMVYYGAVRGSVPKEEVENMYGMAGWIDGIDKLKDPRGSLKWFARPRKESVEELTKLCIDICKRHPIKAICQHTIFCDDRTDPDPPYDLIKLREKVSKAIGRELKDKP